MKKGTLQPDHMPVNKFEFNLVGMPTIDWATVSGMEEELDVVDLPDKTQASGGNTTPVELTATHPVHHKAQSVALEGWWSACQDPVSPSYKKVGYYKMFSLSDQITRTWPLLNIFMTGRTLPDGDSENEGEIALAEYTFSAEIGVPI